VSDRSTGDEDLLRASLHTLADELADAPTAISPDRVRAAYSRRRRTRLAVAGVATAVVVLGAGLPLAAGRLASAPGSPGTEGAGPAAVTTSAGVTTPAEVTPSPTAPLPTAPLPTAPLPTALPTVTPPGAPDDDEARAQDARAAELAASAARVDGSAALAALHDAYLAVHACLTAQGHLPDPPVGREEFVAAAGENWDPYDGLGDRAVAEGSLACPLPQG
jgi:hypothetical protein